MTVFRFCSTWKRIAGMFHDPEGTGYVQGYISHPCISVFAKKINTISFVKI
jgi:hypothetical protein